MAHPVSPYLSTPLLVGQLVANGYDNSSCLDLNVLFFNSILNSKYLSQLISEKNLTEEFQKYLNSNKQKIEQLIKEIDNAVFTYKSDDFYDPKKFFRAMKVLSFAFEVISKRYGFDLSFSDFKVKGFDYSFESIIEFMDKFEIFTDFFTNEIKKIQNADLIGISICYPSQILPALTLAKIAKSHSNAKVAIGGNLITRNQDMFIKNPGFFDIFTDFILTGEGEKSILTLVNSLAKNKPLDEVPGIIYKEKSKIVKNNIEKIKSLSDIAIPNYSGMDFKNYYTPETILPVQLSKGCYWGKCTFCDIRSDKEYFICKTPKQVVDELIELKKKYKIKHFEFTDESMPPEFHSKLADELIFRDADITFYCMVRLEKGFTKELLKKMYKAGARMLEWGFEAASPRIIDLMKKGIDDKERFNILRDSANVGLWNHIFIMFGFPTETPKESLLTAKTVNENKDIIDSYITMDFVLRKHADIQKLVEKYGISETKNETNLLSDYDFSEEDNLKEKRRLFYSKLRKKYLYTNNLPFWQITLPDEYLFLRVAKSSREYIKSIVING